MQEETIKKARVLLGAGVDDDAIISTLNISINDLESIKSGEITAPLPAPLKQGRGSKYVSKVTEEYFNNMKARIDAKPVAVTVNEFCAANDVSTPTYYRIKAAKDLSEYRDMTSANSTTPLKGYTASKPAVAHTKNPYNETMKVVKSEDDFRRLKNEIANRSTTVDEFCAEHHFSRITYYNINKANTYEEYMKAREETQARHAEYKRKKRLERRVAAIKLPTTNAERRADRKEAYETGKLTLEEAVKIVEPYAIPKEEPKKALSQVEVLERIATQLERLADYEQMRLSKKRWFRK